MQANREFVKGLFSLLNDNFNYAVLRGYQELPNNFSSHDIDILIDKNEFNQLKLDINSLKKQHDYKVLMVNENDRFVTFIIAKIINNKLEFLYLDFFFNYSLYGICLIEAHEVLERKKYNGRVYHVDLVDEFLEKYLNTTLLNKSYPEKYDHILRTVVKDHSPQLNTALEAIFNDNTIDIDKYRELSGQKLLLKALFSNLSKKPLKQLIGSLSFIYYYIKGWLSPNGFSFSMTGPDGSGKTTILEGLETILSKVYREVRLHHFRPTVIPRIAEVLKKAKLKKEVDVNYEQPHRGGKTGKLSSWIRLFYYMSDYIIGYITMIKPILFRRGVAIFDRYFTDIVSDSRRSKINLNFKTIFSLRHLIPSMNYNFIIFVKPEIILQRKRELTLKQINEIYKKLTYICETDKQHYTQIENNKKPEVAIKQILDFILDNQDKKYSRYLQ